MNFADIGQEGFERLPNALLLLDEAGVCRAANQAARALCCPLGKDLAGISILDCVAADCQTIAQAWWEQLSQEGQSGARLTLNTADGKSLDIDMTASALKPGLFAVSMQSVVMSSDGSKTHQGESLFRRIIRNSSDIILLLDAEGVVRYVSPAVERITGFTMEELNRPLREKVHPDDLPRLMRAWSQGRKDASVPFTVEFRHAHKNGGYVHLEVIGQNHLADPLLRGVIINTRDISARKRAEEEHLALERQVFHAQKLESLAVLAGGIAHDFNNLLTAILGHASLALLDLPPLSPIRDNIQEITKAAQRAAELANQMLDYSGKGQFLLQRLQLNDLVQEMVHLLSVSMEKKIRLRCHLGEDLPPIQGDANQLRQVIAHLITNASEATPIEDGIVTITTSARHCASEYLHQNNPAYRWGIDPSLSEGRYVSIAVTDSGCGMDESTRQRIFDPFFSTKFPGRGLGLAAVLGIVRSHRGVLKLETHPGKGSRFTVLFPGEAPAAPPPVLPPPSSTADWQGHGLVLLVDDEDAVRSVGVRMLQRLGFQVMVASDGQEALEIFSSRADDIVCVLLDLSMPRMDGEATFAELQRIRRDVPVILCSGFSEKEAIQRFAGKGLAGFVQKPYTHADLAAKFRSLFSSGFSQASS